MGGLGGGWPGITVPSRVTLTGQCISGLGERQFHGWRRPGPKCLLSAKLTQRPVPLGDNPQAQEVVYPQVTLGASHQTLTVELLYLPW
jgi:hypothetical protein